ncbi:glycosyltransferase family 39 protein [Candidatus Roizmanbacteria bacterium]|nr:glycosyltransferase family 39 protein [Candidatus Roizmanbacteria bacterium]
MNFLFNSTPLKFLVQDLWRDEAFSFLLAKKNIFEIIILSAKDYTPPLHAILLHFWVKLFGTSEISLRIPSLLFYWATIYVSYLFLKNIFRFGNKKSFFYLIFLS